MSIVQFNYAPKAGDSDQVSVPISNGFESAGGASPCVVIREGRNTIDDKYLPLLQENLQDMIDGGSIYGDAFRANPLPVKIEIPVYDGNPQNGNSQNGNPQNGHQIVGPYPTNGPLSFLTLWAKDVPLLWVYPAEQQDLIVKALVGTTAKDREESLEALARWQEQDLSPVLQRAITDKMKKIATTISNRGRKPTKKAPAIIATEQAMAEPVAAEPVAAAARTRKK